MSSEIEGAEVEVEIFTLTDEDDQDQDFALLALVEHEGSEYAVLAPVEQLENEEEPAFDLYAFAYNETEDGDITLDAVEDEEILAVVFNAAEREIFGETQEEE